MFSYNKLYQQIDDVAMGCPLAPTMANFLLGHMETIVLITQTSDHPKTYATYMIFLQFLIMITHACHSWRSLNS